LGKAEAGQVSIRGRDRSRQTPIKRGIPAASTSPASPSSALEPLTQPTSEEWNETFTGAVSIAALGRTAVNWKLNTRNENVRPPLPGSQYFESQEDALVAACKLMATQLHTKVLYIDGPSGERIEYAHIEAWCEKRAARPPRGDPPPGRARVEGEGDMNKRGLLDPTPELPDDTPIEDVRFAPRIRNALHAAGLKTVGEVREASDTMLLSLQDLGQGSVAHLRETLGLPSCDGVRPR
jgi:Bacterial RNA polymerase, alpha chain C terminal domain